MFSCTNESAIACACVLAVRLLFQPDGEKYPVGQPGGLHSTYQSVRINALNTWYWRDEEIMVPAKMMRTVLIEYERSTEELYTYS